MENKKILIIDDESINLKELKIRLTKSGYNVVGTVESVNQACNFFSHTLPDLILMDIDLQDKIDGIELASQIKQKYDIPVIYISGISDDENIERIKKTEPYAFISKPINKTELKIAIEIAFYKNKIDKNLKKERDELEKENEKKEKFFSVISHDLKNPVSAIISFSDLLIENYDKYDDEKRKYLLNYLNEASNKLDNLMDKIIKWIKSQRVSFIPVKEKFEINKIIDTSINITKIKAHDKGIEINNNVENSTIAFADKYHIELVLRNIILNAIKYSKPQSKVDINSYETNDYVQISVKDSGIGMSEYTISKLFKIAEQNTIEGTAGESGTGLSLIICKEYIEKNSGKIWAKSTENKGSTFYITIPNQKI